MADGVFTSNKYAFLDEDAPPEPKTKKEAPKKESRKDNRPRATQGSRDRDAPRRDGGGRGRGNRRGGRGGRGGRGKREFDRQSGTGRRDNLRRDGSGKFNWGADGDDGSTDRPRRQGRGKREPKTEEGEASPEADADAPAAEGEAAPEVEETPKEEEPELLGYDDYLKQQADKALEEDNVQRRQVNNQGFETTSFEKFQEEEGQFENLVTAKQTAAKKGKSKNRKEILSFDEFAASGKKDNRRGQRDGRRGGRGRGRNTFRMGESDFPKLG